MRFASREKAVFGQIEIALGVVPGSGATDWLSKLAGRAPTLEIRAGADDFDADIAERYGWINRAMPDAELNAIVDRLAHRISLFDAPVLELAKQSVKPRAAMSSDAERWASNHAFLQTTTWPGVRERAVRAMELGLQQRVAFEQDLGANLEALYPH